VNIYEYVKRWSVDDCERLIERLVGEPERVPIRACTRPVISTVQGRTTLQAS
jgi:hypothetical protein